MLLTCFDTECSGAQRNKANPYDPRNKCCITCVRIYDTETKEFVKYSYDIEDPQDLYAFQEILDKSYWVVGFNLKFDMAWVKRYGITFNNCKFWDVQLVHFIYNGQQPRFPSLDGVAEFYKLPKKLDVVKTEYWELGLDTDQVPLDILDEYCSYDVELTLNLAMIQMKEFKALDNKLQTTIRLALEDLEGLAEMEYSGFLFDVDASVLEGERLEKRAEEIRYDLSSLTDTLQYVVNWGSSDQISSILYGGTITHKYQEEYLFEYKDPKKKPVMKTRWVEQIIEMPRLVEPLRRTELKKEGKWQTNEDTLRKLKTNKRSRKIVDLLLELAKIDKLTSTYFFGLPKKIEEIGWQNNYIHTGLNQCVVITGRLSSTAP